jgi:hypothetical protein
MTACNLLKSLHLGRMIYPYNRDEGQMGDRWDGDTGGISRRPRSRWDGDVSGTPPASPGGGGRLLQQHPLHTDTIPPTETPHPGQLAYEEDVRRKPAYDTGHPRIGWHQLGDVERLSWIRNPTPRDWTPPKEPPDTPQTSIPFYTPQPPVTG